MEKFTFTVLKDSSKTEKGNITTFMRVSQPNGILDNEIATGYVRTTQELKAGHSFDLTGSELIVKQSKNPILIDGKEVHADWIALKP